jgi:hypothetical protein
MNTKNSASGIILRTAGVVMRLTQKDGVTSSSDKCADSSHHAAVLVFITEVGRNDAENEGAGVWRHLVMVCEILGPALGG